MQRSVQRGFTLVELLVVIVIIAILLGFILSASLDAQHRAEENATLSLITKLETALNDRLEALLQTRPDYNAAHYYVGAIFNSGYFPNANYPNNGIIPGIARAQVIAWYDYVKAELPDVFYVQNQVDSYYPINFSGNPYPGTSLPSSLIPSRLVNYASVILPLGNTIQGPYPNGYGDGNSSNPAGTGIFGASYSAAAGIYKNLGYLPTGYDGIDNSGDGLIDDYYEGVCYSPNWTQPDPTVSSTVTANLNRHTHNTARSEMLYAILVEGRGPLGSVFNRDDFTDKEVQDTDGDGLPEFVDAWGQPLQFFRWPLLYHSNLQRGQTIVPAAPPVYQDPTVSSPVQVAPGTLILPYKSVIEEREQDPLDVNQQLMAPGWWSTTTNGGVVAANNSSPYASGGSALPPPVLTATTKFSASGGLQAFEYFFHRISEPLAAGFSSAYALQPWDRGGYPGRRAFYSKFLILSGGQDQQPGVFLYTDTALASLAANQSLTSSPPTSPASWALIANENNALPFSITDVADFTGVVTITNPTVIGPPSSYDPANPNSYDLQQSAQDDISNHNIQSTVGIGGSG